MINETYRIKQWGEEHNAKVKQKIKEKEDNWHYLMMMEHMGIPVYFY